MVALNISPPTHYIKATESIAEIIVIVSRLQFQSNAYEVAGTVYFDITSFPAYGTLSALTKEEMIELSRQRGANPNDPKKRNKLDFILWQKSVAKEPFWESPWGRGRPGWHIECSAMIYKTLGTQIDIHGGGFDLIYPHHESEIAQSESFTGEKPFARYFVHAGMLRYQGEKMSKSLGNLILVSDLLGKYTNNAVRWMLLSHHYRSEWEYFDQDIKNAQKEIDTIFKTIQNNNIITESPELLDYFEALMEDDFNTPEVLALLLVSVKDPKSVATIKLILKILGFVL